MIYLYTYIIGLLLSICVAGFLNRGNTLTHDEGVGLTWTLISWPLTLAVLVVITFPILLFYACKGELDDEIKQGITWIKTKWNSIGD